MRSIGPLIAGSTALLATAVPAMADGPYESFVSSATWQDNVTNAASGDGVLCDLSLKTGVDLSWIHSVDFSTLFSTTVSTAADISTRYSGLDNVCVGPRFELRHKFALGPLAPSAYLGLEGLASGFDDPQRSNIAGAFVFGFQQRPADSLNFSLDGRLGSYDARDIVYTGDYASLESSLKWDVDDTWRLKLAVGWRDGDGVADYAAIKTSVGWLPIDPDAYYEPGAWHYVSTFNQPFVAYKVSARTWSFGAGVSPALGNHTALSLSYTRFDSQATRRYSDDVASISVVHHF